jgi:hypothetical protein
MFPLHTLTSPLFTSGKPSDTATTQNLRDLLYHASRLSHHRLFVPFILFSDWRLFITSTGCFHTGNTDQMRASFASALNFSVAGHGVLRPAKQLQDRNQRQEHSNDKNLNRRKAVCFRPIIPAIRTACQGRQGRNNGYRTTLRALTNTLFIRIS